MMQSSKELQLLHSISGCFRPGVMTALMGATGAGAWLFIRPLAATAEHEAQSRADSDGCEHAWTLIHSVPLSQIRRCVCLIMHALVLELALYHA